MQWWEKILSIPAVLILYLFLVDFIASNNVFISSIGNAADYGGSLQIGIGQSVGVSVTRKYFFDMLTMPVYSGALGDIGIYHDMFFNFLYILTAVVVVSIIGEKFGINIGSFLNKGSHKKAYKQRRTKKRGGR